MSEVKLKATLPKDWEANGIGGDEWADHFDTSDKPVLALVLLQTEEVTEKRASLSRIPKVTITRIEPVTDEAEAAALIEKLQGWAAERTGKTQLPIAIDPEPSTPLDLDTPLAEQGSNVTDGPWGDDDEPEAS